MIHKTFKPTRNRTENLPFIEDKQSFKPSGFGRYAVSSFGVSGILDFGVLRVNPSEFKGIRTPALHTPYLACRYQFFPLLSLFSILIYNFYTTNIKETNLKCL